MSQQVPVRGSAPSQRGTPLVAIVIAILVIGGAVWGGLYWYSNRPVAGGGAERTAADSVKSTIGELEDNLKTIETEKDPANVDEAIGNIKTLAETDITDLSAQVAKAPADVKAKITAMLAEQLPKLQPQIDKAYLVPGVKERLEPLITKLMAGLKGLGV